MRLASPGACGAPLARRARAWHAGQSSGALRAPHRCARGLVARRHARGASFACVGGSLSLSLSRTTHTTRTRNAQHRLHAAAEFIGSPGDLEGFPLDARRVTLVARSLVRDGSLEREGQSARARGV